MPSRCHLSEALLLIVGTNGETRMSPQGILPLWSVTRLQVSKSLVS